jgi:ATP-dependent exoDNAse (exonuclease V) beta subunit
MSRCSLPQKRGGDSWGKRSGSWRHTFAPSVCRRTAASQGSRPGLQLRRAYGARGAKWVCLIFVDRDGDTLLHGTIDLVFREEAKWFIVDYKSDSTQGRLESLVQYYTPQVAHYARFWRELTGVETEAGLFFVDGSVMRWT